MIMGQNVLKIDYNFSSKVAKRESMLFKKFVES